MPNCYIQYATSSTTEELEEIKNRHKSLHPLSKTFNKKSDGGRAINSSKGLHHLLRSSSITKDPFTTEPTTPIDTDIDDEPQ